MRNRFVERASAALVGLPGLMMSLCLVACVDDAGGGASETEVISRIELAFSPSGGGSALVFAFEDADGEGGMSGSAEPITLTQGGNYTLEIRFFDTLADPIEDVSDEIEEEAEEHQIFLYGDAVVGPASNSGSFLVSHSYADLESDYTDNSVGEDLPVGLSGEISAENTGVGELVVMLRHLPALNGEAQKVAGLAESLAAGEALPGDVDVNVAFALTVE